MLDWFRRRRAWRPIPGADRGTRSTARRHNTLFMVYVVVVLIGIVWAVVASNTP